jgi:hypothetical protein
MVTTIARDIGWMKWWPKRAETENHIKKQK